MAKALEAYWNDLRGTKVWRSVFRSGAGTSNLHRSLAVQQNVFLHLASVKMRRSTDGIVTIVGPASKRKPSPATVVALPPSHSFRSKSVTAYPRAASVQAAANPPSPPPMTPMRSFFDLVMLFPFGLISFCRRCFE